MRRLGALLLLIAPFGLAAQTDVGGQSESFALLNRSTGARALALGGAYEALAEGASGVLWNPAAPALAKGLEFGLDHETLLVGTDREMLSAQAPALSWLSVGAFGTMVSYPSVELRDSSGSYRSNYSPREQGGGLTLAVHHNGLALGIGGRVLSQDMPGFASRAYAAETGLLWDVVPALRLGVAVKALPQADQSYKTRGAGGVSVHGKSAAWAWDLASSVRLDPASTSELDLGVEGIWDQGVPVSMRLGYSQDFPALSQSLGQRFAAGLGVGYQHYQVDYAYLPWGDFGGTHRLSFSFHQEWDRPQAKPKEAPKPAPVAQPYVAPLPLPMPTPAPTPVPTMVPSQASPDLGLPGTQFRVLSDGVAQARDLEAAGNLEGALKAYHSAASADPADGEAWRGMARLYSKVGRGDYAKRCWSEVLRLAPQDAEALAGLQAP